MASNAPYTLLRDDDVNEENAGLLPPATEPRKGDKYRQFEGHMRIILQRLSRIWIAALLLLLLFLGYAVVFEAPIYHHQDTTTHMFSGTTLRSNGTHDYKRTVLMVSIDGLRADYLDRGLTPHLLAISKKGLRAKSMQPIFPTLTFPNHWALMTGLYAESHGIVANNFWDPVTQEEFHYNQAKSAWKADWWLGEPMWETAEKAGVPTANLMWPGPPKTTRNGSSKYFIPWRDHVPLSEKLDQLLQWIDMPLESRPQLIVAYEPSLDQAGHKFGPKSAQVNASLVAVDTFAKDLQDSLEARNLTDIVDVVFVSDHGMTDTSHPELIYLDDLIGTDGVKAIEHEDGWPAMGLRFRADANITQHLNALLVASGQHPEKFEVYTHETMPQRWHFANNERIAPIWVVPKIGYVLTTRKENASGMNKGSHGYDNSEKSMQAMFVAHGPFSHHTKAMANNRKMAAKGHGPMSSLWKGGCMQNSADEEFVVDTFKNVELYNLIMRLLGVPTEQQAPNNGTVGFWDQYL